MTHEPDNVRVYLSAGPALADVTEQWSRDRESVFKLRKALRRAPTPTEIYFLPVDIEPSIKANYDFESLAAALAEWQQTDRGELP